MKRHGPIARRWSNAMQNPSLRRTVSRMVAEGKGKTGKALQGTLNSTAEKPYPLKKLGSRAKVPHTAYGQWDLIRNVRESMGQRFVPGKMVRAALYQRSAAEYEKEWTTSGKKKHTAEKKPVQTANAKMAQWAQDIGRNIRNANATNARNVLPDLRARINANQRTGQAAVLVDLGCGAGATVLPVVNGLNASQKKNLRIVLVDVSAKDLETARKSVIAAGVPAENVKTAKVNFGEMQRSAIIRALAGKADMVISGAALHHLSRSETIFEQVEKMLKKGGSFRFWDWCHPAWRAPALVIAPKGALVSANGRAYKLGRKIIKAEKGIGFISQGPAKGRGRFKVPSELAQTREMLSTWISLLNFPETERRKFEQWFDAQAGAKRPIKFGEYLERMTSIAPSKEAQIEVMEGHRRHNLYERALRASGLEVGRTSFSPDSVLLAHFEARKK